jgi:hypothetical protein
MALRELEPANGGDAQGRSQVGVLPVLNVPAGLLELGVD